MLPLISWNFGASHALCNMLPLVAAFCCMPPGKSQPPDREMKNLISRHGGRGGERPTGFGLRRPWCWCCCVSATARACATLRAFKRSIESVKTVAPVTRRRNFKAARNVCSSKIRRNQPSAELRQAGARLSFAAGARWLFFNGEWGFSALILSCHHNM